MRGVLEGPIRSWWYGEGGVAGAFLTPATLPFSLLYRITIQLRNALYDRDILPVRRGPVPVISVGNLVVGGTGKTPTAAWIVEAILELGGSPALVARGYGEDELLLHRRWNPSAPVIRAPERVDGVVEAARRGATVCVLDDGFQHRRLARDLDIVLVSVRDPVPARLLPRGPYREPFSNLRRAHLILVTGHGEQGREETDARAAELARRPGFPPVVPFVFQPGAWRSLDGGPGHGPSEPSLVVCSVARPESVAALAREAKVEVTEILAFPDHHEYSTRDVERMLETGTAHPIVTTEKDAVKLARVGAPAERFHVLTLEPSPAPGVNRIIRRLLGEVLDAEGSRSGTRDPGTERST